jgi:hypothetical protein
LTARDEGNALLTLDVLRARAEAFIKSSQARKAEADLKDAVTRVEQYRFNLAGSEDRSRFLDARQRVFDELVSLDAGTLSRHADAFDVSERARARTLLDEIKGREEASSSLSIGPSLSSAVPLTLDQVRRGLPEDLTLLEYSVTDHGTYIFVVSRKAFSAFKSPATTAMLDRLAQSYVADMSGVPDSSRRG